MCFKKFKFIFGLYLFITGFAEGKVLSVYEDAPIEIEFSKADNQTLVIFDCNEVIFTSDDPLPTPINKKIFKKLRSYLQKRTTKSQYYDLMLKIRKQINHKLVNPKWPHLISVLQSRGIKTLMITAHWTGPFKNIAHLEDIRRDEVLSFGINFKKSWPDLDTINFKKLPATSPDYGLHWYPVFKDGIICSCNLEKGKVLRAFLKNLKYKFKKIIFIDNQMKHINSVRKIADEFGMEYVGIEYKKSEKIPTGKVKYEEEKKFVDRLIETGKWR